MAESVGLKTLAWRLIVQTEGVEKNTRNAANSLAKFGQQASRLGVLLRSAGVVLAAREYLKLADAYTTMQNKLRLVTTNQAELNAVQREVVGIAQSTRSDLESTADLYARAARSLQDYGLSQREVLKFTESVSQAIQISGATAKEASQGVIQFSQGLGSGKLAGDELRAVLEQMPRLGRAIAEGMGVSYGALRKLGAEGKIAGQQILDAIKKAGPEIAKEFSSMTPTVEAAMTTVKNGLTVLIGEFDRGLGLSKSFATMLQTLGLAMSDLAPKAAEAGVSVREFLEVSSYGFARFFKEIVPKWRQWRAEQTMKNTENTPENKGIFETAEGELADAQYELSIYAETWDNVVDDMTAKYAKLRKELADEGNLDKKGKKKIGPTDEELKRRAAQSAGLDRLEAKASEGLQKTAMAMNALRVEIDEGAAASDRYSEAAEIRWELDNDLLELAEKTGPLDEERVTGIKNLTEAYIEQNGALMEAADAWSIVNGEIEAGKDSFEQAQDEVNLLSRAILVLGNEMGKGQMEAAIKRIRVLQGELTDTAKLSKDMFGTAIMGLTDFLMDGAEDVKGFVRGMIKELGKLVVQFLLIRAVKGTAFQGVFGAKGMVVEGGGLVPFAQGGIVGGPTAFPMSGGRTGVMGEAGPEAVMPLARLPSGDLGVRAMASNIQVINKTGVNASARLEQSGDRTSIILEAAELGALMAESRMTRSMRNGYGPTASTMQRTYALRRQG